jgi:hypothetical protein
MMVWTTYDAGCDGEFSLCLCGDIVRDGQIEMMMMRCEANQWCSIIFLFFFGLS